MLNWRAHEIVEMVRPRDGIVNRDHRLCVAGGETDGVCVMTEDEAKKKWCPFVRLVVADATGADPSSVAANRVGVRGTREVKLPDAACCIASACMAWRWSETKRSAAFLEAVQAHMAASAKPNFNTSVQAVYAETGGKFERSEGYCGLAGAPQ